MDDVSLIELRCHTKDDPTLSMQMAKKINAATQHNDSRNGPKQNNGHIFLLFSSTCRP